MPSSDPREDSEYRKCSDCGAVIPGWQKRHRARTCPGYSGLWAGDVRVKLFAAVRAYAEMLPSGVKTAQVRMLTITAPGVDAGLPWDESVCAHRGPHRHDGRDGCRVVAAAAATWNERAPGWWRSLHHDARQAVVRDIGHGPTLLVRPWELQQRGMLHVHPILGYSTLAEKRAADAYLVQLQERATAAGFGFVDRKRQVREPTAAAAYLAAYFVEGKKGKLTLRESVTSTAMPRSIVYVNPELSQHSGVTMRSLRLKRYLYVQLEQLLYVLLGRGFTLDDLWRLDGVGGARLLITDLQVRGP